MPFADADGVRIHYETCGSGNLKIILLHGWGGSSSYWRDLVSQLNLKNLQIFALSYRGHGDSDKPTTVGDFLFVLNESAQSSPATDTCFDQRKAIGDEDGHRPWD